MKHGLNRPALEYGSGFPTLLFKEVKRFYKVAFQTVAAPVLTAVLYLMIFGHVLEGREVYGRLSYTAFLIPGLVMMSVLQNAFANTSSSLIQSKVTGNLVFVLLAPLSHFEFYSAYILAAVFRGIVVGLGVLLITIWFATPTLEYPLWILTFAFLGAAILGSLGLIAGIWADKYDQLAAFQNFIIMPATMLSGVFYSIHSLPPAWQVVSHFNPFFYMIDGFRYGFFGVSDNSPWSSLVIVFCFFVVVSVIALRLLQKGYKLRY
ncbi:MULTISPECIES: ABC transporter permease [unclassified Polynucleobacter]|jgi:ABC-2 type transport system permease protein|uniref:ABC transporter permease n=1 Tax=unclassified Polynucleobacter TaxID=2640945 RepID=UPI001BFCE8BC|nr:MULTISPECIES: ABC transporter permease [unclassified Polynucleobacter]MBU3627426.1 ABC transporter permease [Polynucleobacter sp. AP-Reno-20A-A9]MBU3638313.1 ABC transporter permease [Polynucleobacter sp. AP-RePozz3-80-G7]QWD81713.1 ABC transporter permease [Polynucleobacter sp. MWH-S4W17]